MPVQKEFKKSYILTYSLSVVNEIFEKFTHFNKILYIYNVSLAIVLSSLLKGVCSGNYTILRRLKKTICIQAKGRKHEAFKTTTCEI